MYFQNTSDHISTEGQKHKNRPLDLQKLPPPPEELLKLNFEGVSKGNPEKQGECTNKNFEMTKNTFQPPTG